MHVIRAVDQAGGDALADQVLRTLDRVVGPHRDAGVVWWGRADAGVVEEIDDIEAVAARDQRLDHRVAGDFGAAAVHRLDPERALGDEVPGDVEIMLLEDAFLARGEQHGEIGDRLRDGADLGGLLRRRLQGREGERRGREAAFQDRGPYRHRRTPPLWLFQV